MKAVWLGFLLCIGNPAIAQDLPPYVFCSPPESSNGLPTDSYFVPHLNFIVWDTARKAPFVPMSDVEARRIAPTDEIVFAGRVLGESIGQAGKLEFVIVEISPERLKLFLEDNLEVNVLGFESPNIGRGIVTRECEWR